MAALPTTNITTTLVANTLGVSTRNVGELCAHSKINMWSKRKPVRDPRLSVPEAEVGVSASNDYGLTFPAYAGDDTLLTIYKKPGGGSAQPFRLGDFRGYDHGALPPVRLPLAPDKLEKRRHTISAMISLPGSSNVSIGDIMGFEGNLRLGVMVYEPGGGLIGAASAQEAGGGSVIVDFTGLAYTGLTVKFCLTDYYKSWATPGGMTALFEIPRKLSTENKNWPLLDLVAYTPPTAVPVFTVTHNPSGAGSLDIRIETQTYTGAIFIQYLKKSDLSFGGSSTFTHTIAGQVVEYSESSVSWLQPGVLYEARLWLSATPSGAFAASTLVTVFQEM